MTPESAIAILKDSKEFESWGGVAELSPDRITLVFSNIERARRGNPEATRLIIETFAEEFDEQVRGLTTLPGGDCPGEGESAGESLSSVYRPEKLA